MALLSSLTNRIFLATATLAMLAIGFAVYFVTGRVIDEAEAELARGLIEAGKLVEQHRTTLVDTFTVEAQLIADLPRLKAAVDTRDPPTVAPIASENQALIGANLFVVTDRNGRVLSALGAELESGAIVVDRPGIKPALSGQKFNSFWPTGRGVLQVVTVPIAIGLGSPEILGTLSVGFLMDDQLATQFKSLTDSEVAFAIGGEIRAATVPSTDHSALASLLGSEGVTQITLNGNEYSALVQPLLPPLENGGAAAPATLGIGVRPSSATVSAGPHVPAAIIMRSRTERLRVLNELFAGLGGAALLAVILAIGLSYGVARTVTRPLAAITAAMREMASTGDLTRKISLPGRGHWEDEDTSLLAKTFNTLTDSIARFQREAAQRERLSSLGRLSTVIAHEVRNPLMIIKAALRTIRREEASADEVRDAAADIDEEVRRLNRVVNDVLDFSRPIKFEMAPVDLNALCSECAAATVASGRGPVVRVIGDPAVTRIVTDSDRLRIALVNIFVNAQHAVSDHRSGSGHNGEAPLPDVEVRTARGDSKVRIVVSDRGGGIPAKDVSRIFDPYFTTKRTGTGLGLAIAKNIVEGLGGTIVVETRLGEGTDMRVELPDNISDL
ncbi:MAG TPA: ATP-binding protein [Vicinamibacterales bacterium]|jgi:signal transduction histidine kinase